MMEKGSRVHQGEMQNAKLKMKKQPENLTFALCNLHFQMRQRRRG
jgi:hypothetical protein